MDQNRQSNDVTNIFYISNSNIASVGAPLDGTPSREPTEIEEDRVSQTQEDAIVKLLTVQDKYREDDVVCPGISTSDRSFPVLHPQMSETSLYDSGLISDDVFRPTQPAGLAAVPRPSSERVQFDEILSRFRDQRFIGLVGAPGSGKTTCSKRLAKTVGKKCFFLKFMDMNYDSEISLKELIVDKPFRSLSDSLRQHAFEWILNNQAECVFILDGYDQARWRLPTRPINATPYDQIDIAHLIANICLGQLLQDSCIIFTSRQYSMISIPYDLRPKVIILLQDFNMEDTKTLFCALSSRMDKKLTTSPETMWDALNTEAPQLVSICHNPLMLQFTARACVRNKRMDILTVTHVFACVVECLRRSENPRGSEQNFDLRSIIPKLADLSFKATDSSTIVLNHTHLTDAGLTMDDVKDLILFVYICGVDNVLTHRLFVGDYKLYFSHQCLQEYFSAHYICYHMSKECFQTFINKEIFAPQREHSTDKWSMVRRFTCGILARPDDLLTNRRMLLFQKFKSKFRSISMTTVKTSPRTAADQTAREILTLLLDIREFNDTDKDKDVASLLPRTMRFNNILLTDSEAHCIGRVLCHREKDLDELSFSRCSLTTKRFNHIKGAVVEMKAMIGRLNINSNNLNSVDDLCAVLHKVQNKVFMIGCFAGLAAWRYANEEETDVLQRKLDELQSPSLSIEIAREEILTARQT